MTTPREPVLLLHGQPGTARDWDRVVAALDGRVETIAVDRPGWDGIREPRDLAGNVACAVQALDLRGVTRATIVGHSFGAAIAAWTAIDHPERVGALVLLAPAVNVESLQWIDWCLGAPYAGPVLSTAAVAGPGYALACARARRWLAPRFGLSVDYLTRFGAVLRRPSAWRTFIVEQRAMLSQLPVLESGLSRISAPTTIMIGSADRVVSRRLGEGPRRPDPRRGAGSREGCRPSLGAAARRSRRRGDARRRGGVAVLGARAVTALTSAD